MKTKKLLSILMATTMTIGMFAPTVAFAEDLNQTSTQVVAETVEETQKPKVYLTSDPVGYYPEENKVCLAAVYHFYIIDNENFRFANPIVNLKVDTKTPLNQLKTELINCILKSNNISEDYYLNPNNFINYYIDIEFYDSTNSNRNIYISSLDEDLTIEEKIEKSGIRPENLNYDKSDIDLIQIMVQENDILRNMKINYDVKTEDGKLLTPNELPNLYSNIDNLKISPKDVFSHNKYLSFDYLSEGSKFKPEDLVKQNIVMHLDYGRYTYGGKQLNPNETSVDIVYDKQVEEEFKSMSFEEVLNKKGLELCKFDGDDYIVLDNVTFDVNYVVRDSAYDAETGTMRSDSSYEVVTEDGKTLTNVELPNLPANNYEEKIDVNKELEDSLEFYEDNYLNTIDDDEIEEEQLNVHMVLNDGNVFDILIDEDDDLYDDITLKGLVESKGYKLEDVKEYSTKYVFVLDDDVFETDDDDEDEFDEEDFEEDDDDEDDKAERKHNKKSKNHRKNHK